MKGSFQIARIFNIPLLIHWTFALLILGGIYFGYSQNWGMWESVWAVLLVGSLFGSVVLHEFGHALTARRYGVDTRDIILSPIGGVARLTRLPDSPRQEFMVAIAGPMVNIVIALLLTPYLFSKAATRNQLLTFLDRNSNVFLIDLSPFDDFLIGLFLLNGILAVFNLLPAFPMDGGRILRALLSLRLGRMRATRIATLIGQALAVLFVVYGFWSWSPVTAFIGLFVFVTASSENRMVKLDSLLEKHQVSRIVRRSFTRIYHPDPMELPVEALTHGLERNFLVFDEWHNLSGVLGEEQLMRAIREKNFGAPVADYMTYRYEAILATDSLKEALAKLQGEDHAALPVYQNGVIIGVVDLQGINNFLQLQREKRK